MNHNILLLNGHCQHVSNCVYSNCKVWYPFQFHWVINTRLYHWYILQLSICLRCEYALLLICVQWLINSCTNTCRCLVICILHFSIWYTRTAALFSFFWKERCCVYYHLLTKGERHTSWCIHPNKLNILYLKHVAVIKFASMLRKMECIAAI